MDIEEIWKKINENPLLMMLLCCLIPLLLIYAAFSLGVEIRNYSWVILLLCPLSMLFMMKNMHHGEEHSEHKTDGIVSKNAPADKKGSCH